MEAVFLLIWGLYWFWALKNQKKDVLYNLYLNYAYMRFRRLKREELEPLEQEFIHFLATHQITAQEWVQLKETEHEKVYELIDIFSDIVLEKVYNQIEYLQHRTKDTIRVFHCQDEKITMTGLQITDPERDLTNPADVALLSQPNGIQGTVKIFQMEKEYQQGRPDEVFQMMHRDGCQPASASMFNALIEMYHGSAN